MTSFSLVGGIEVGIEVGDMMSSHHQAGSHGCPSSERCLSL
jgi:hypothetical protein